MSQRTFRDESTRTKHPHSPQPRSLSVTGVPSPPLQRERDKRRSRQPWGQHMKLRSNACLNARQLSLCLSLSLSLSARAPLLPTTRNGATKYLGTNRMRLTSVHGACCSVVVRGAPLEKGSTASLPAVLGVSPISKCAAAPNVYAALLLAHF